MQRLDVLHFFGRHLYIWFVGKSRVCVRLLKIVLIFFRVIHAYLYAFQFHFLGPSYASMDKKQVDQY